jgi:cytochrome c
MEVSSLWNIVDNTPICWPASRGRAGFFEVDRGDMMRSVFGFFLLVIVGLFNIPAAHAQSTTGLALAESSKCMACHQVDKKRVGPSFEVIAERFAGQEGAVPYLSNAIMRGGRGRWGAIPMPAQPQVSPANAQLLAAWILSLAEKPAIRNE